MDHQFPCWQDIALPLILLLTGLVLVGGDWVGLLSLDRIENLWPCAPLLIGLAQIASPSRSAGPDEAAQRLNQSRRTF